MVAPESSCFYDRCAAQSGIVRLMLDLPRHRRPLEVPEGGLDCSGPTPSL